MCASCRPSAHTASADSTSARPTFCRSVPFALKSLRWLHHNVQLPIAIPTLLDAFHSMLGSEKLQALAAPAEGLTVRIFSFSFHREPPVDEEGNGGGFVFDGRSLPNPGREERFSQLTGQDAPVIEYLDAQESVRQFKSHVESLVDASVSSYQRRGFKSLMVSFGCTGGQHRSVYLAEHLATHLRARSGVRVVLRHIELEKMGRVGEARLKRGRIDESNGAGRGPRHAPAPAHRQSPQGAGHRRRPHLLEITLARLRAAGVTEVIVNAHHFADQIEQYLKGREDFGLRIEVSREAELLDTGGGIKHAAWFFLEDGPDRDAPFHRSQRRRDQHHRSRRAWFARTLRATRWQRWP